MMIWGNGMSGWAMTLMGLSNLLFWGLLITGVVLLVRRPDRSTSTRSPAGATPTPQQVLAERFARGEIEQDEYASRLQVLNSTVPQRPAG